MGIRGWVNPLFEDETPVGKADIKEFLDEVRTTYSNNHPKRALGILDELSINNNSCTLPTKGVPEEHDVAFYFRNHELQHAARYVNTIEGSEVNSWTSKLGESMLISHILEDLNDLRDNATYGVAECLVGRTLEYTITVDVKF